jgi:hypothetical protein
MKPLGLCLLVLAGLPACGCGAQSTLLGTSGSSLLTGSDLLATPLEQVDLRAQFRRGDYLQGAPGYMLRFWRDGELYKAAETDSDGIAKVSFAPPRAGDYRFRVEVAPVGMPDAPPAPIEILVACRPADTPMVIVDMDKTIVASGFHAVLLGNPEPMEGSQRVLTSLAGQNTVVYLTHRPDLFGLKSKRWLVDNGYPPGPVLLSSVGGFLKGSGAFKTEMIAQLRKRFTNLRIGIGDKISDAQSYRDNGMQAFLIVEIPRADKPEALRKLADELQPLDESVHVVTHWNQIQEVLAGKAAYTRPQMQARLRQMADGATTQPQ